MQSDYQRRPLEPQEPKISSQVREPQTYIRPKKPRISISNYPGLSKRDMRTAQNFYLDRQKWDQNLERRQAFNTSQVRVRDQSLQKMKDIINKRYSAMGSKWDLNRRKQQVRKRAIIKPTVEGLPNQLEPISESFSEDESEESDAKDYDLFHEYE